MSSSIILLRGYGRSRKAVHLRTLKNFSKKVERLAREVERVNSSPLFDPHLCWRPSDGLPEELRRYAQLVRQRIYEREVYLQECKKQWSKGTKALVFLVQTVTENTGTPKFQKVADLLTEAALAFGVDTQYDPDAIKMRVQRWVPESPTCAHEQE